MTSTFTALTERDEGWWIVQLKEEPGLITQARRLSQVPDAVRDALELFPELISDPSSASINVEVIGDEYLTTLPSRAVEASDEARKSQERASALMHEAARGLANRGVPYRDIGTLLGVSFQRAQKLATS